MRRPVFAALACLALAAAPTACRRPAPASSMAADTAWVSRAVIYELFVQDFSAEGNFAGVTAGLDRVQAAGADVIWLMPIHPLGVLNRKDPLGSPYAVRDYHAINPAYGTAADLHALVRAAHARGLRVIIDWVPDHTAWDAVWATEHPEWYFHTASGQLQVPKDPQGNLTNWTDVVQLDYGKPELRRAMIAEMQYWLREFELDGFRVDVAGWVPLDFWREALPILRATQQKRILLLAEAAERELHGAGFDLTYGWDGYNRLKGVWGGDSAATFARRIAADQDSLPRGTTGRLRFTTNHDETAWDNPPVLRFQNAAGARAAYAAIALLPGRPLLYNGQEVESPQKLGLFQREAIRWDQPAAQQAREYYRRVADLAHTHPAVVSGGFVPLATSAPADVIAYRRENLVVLVNVRQSEQRFTVDSVAVAGARDLLTGRVQASGDVTLPPYGVLLLELRARSGM